MEEKYGHVGSSEDSESDDEDFKEWNKPSSSKPSSELVMHRRSKGDEDVQTAESKKVLQKIASAEKIVAEKQTDKASEKVVKKEGEEEDLFKDIDTPYTGSKVISSKMLEKSGNSANSNKFNMSTDATSANKAWNEEELDLDSI
eukprot:CAMPEP_0115039750 /NCGR_PEP_ID=MMETSP0216-20121206/44311_1 /TAXON_ID=223996 /ORGANISM="Protocruzia adherens, Strain Boccale" /LENGTH=143 /DNA_ID=CAMNT_0002420643 /DNA_START=129 /DNA_END=560 /DNA_ORIENTATION=+